MIHKITLQSSKLIQQDKQSFTLVDMIYFKFGGIKKHIFLVEVGGVNVPL